MSARQAKPSEKQSRPLQILIYTPQSGGIKGVPQTSEVFDVGGRAKDVAPGGSRMLEFTDGNGEILRIPEYTTHIIPHPASTPGKLKAYYQEPITTITTPAPPLYPNQNHPYPGRFLHCYPSHREPTFFHLPRPPPPPPPPPPAPPPPPLLPLPPQQQPQEFSMTTMTIPPISEEEWNMLISPEFPPQEMLGLELGSSAAEVAAVEVEEMLENSLPVFDNTGQQAQGWYEFLGAEGDEEGFWTKFLGDEGDSAGWDGEVQGEVQGGCNGGFEGSTEG
ncbi:hypothetical protein L873DRAFT_1823674 [Choiromyces venosus 120613-1]|uniref:Uncharacterized protein n=1 Tax=Choiromyces venosus 120613-1 TaxID=1336337 RepID=A0A3N4IXT3_9PEZI|nr:hypothetical protein L873DRAFT_1823674 [Choiromyces venosus 120613-1]